MDREEQEDKLLSMESTCEANVCEGEKSGNSAINKFCSLPCLSNQVASTFCHAPYSFSEIQKSNTHGLGPDSVYCESQSLARLHEEIEKENDLFTAVQCNSAKYTLNRHALLGKDFCSAHESLLHLSPGNKALNAKMKNKLRILNERNELRKNNIRTRSARKEVSNFCNKTEENKKRIYISALTSWLNYILDENEIFDKNKDADKYLKHLLLLENCHSPNDDELYNMHSYKYFITTKEFTVMRAKFVSIYESSLIPESIASDIQNDHISIREDKKIYADIGLQVELLKLFFTFHPFYLQLGLEIILSIKIKDRAGSTSHMKTLASVISQYIFRDPKIMNDRKYVKGRSKNLISDRGSKLLGQNFLTKICQFLFIVGKAWIDRPIRRRNRFNFQSIGDVVAVLSKELIAGRCSLPKNLRYFGFDLDSKQDFLDEFRYHVTDLLKDLNDGVILGRAVEVLANLEYGAVINCLRNPRGDRLRKMANIKSVIDLAKQKEVLPKDLHVDIISLMQGKLDVILSLLEHFVGVQLGIGKEVDNGVSAADSLSYELEHLFGISYKIESLQELADGKLLSLIWKRYYSYGTTFEMFDGTTVLQKIFNAAEYHFGIPSVIIQKDCGFDEKALYLFTKIFISNVYDYHRLNSAAVTIQRFFRRNRVLKTMHSDDANEQMQSAKTKFVHGSPEQTNCEKILRECSVMKEEQSAIVIQKYVRTWLAKKLFRKMREEKILSEREQAVCILQKYTRVWLAKRLFRRMQAEEIFQKREHAAITLQRYARGWIARKKFSEIYPKSTKYERTSFSASLTSHSSSSIKVCSVDEAASEKDGNIISNRDRIRMFRELEIRHYCLRKRHQRFVRILKENIKLMQSSKTTKEVRTKAATLIQAWWRGNFVRKRHISVCCKLPISYTPNCVHLSDEMQ
ncbi:unnamed protein product [Thelazia callipaeda]|uniref:Calponin-homology (CH) domain-containing protein n=1 Tax=Thelazia callipaeda TaxID=103827 RepID=A0A0N5D767_THECL|nr:unnamed protein product [Thelazia callipaeda]